MQSDTIVAVATPPGRGGVGIVRVSGPHASVIGLAISRQSTLPLRQAVYTRFYSSTNELIDQGLVIYFQAPKTFTGEDVVEFHAHGSPFILDSLVAACLDLNARMARPGEFSERAFFNEKLDLAQAEAIADLISASSKTAARMAVRSLQGDFSKQIHTINEKIVHLRIYVEASIDFPEEEVDFLSDRKIQDDLETILEDLEKLKASTSQGVLVREGLSIVIAGRPNAGKSTLINALAGKEIAIVTEIEGTTRDVLREQILMDDLPLQFIDTAGLRESHDRVEKEGIKRTWQELNQADCILLIIDVNNPEGADCLRQEILSKLPSSIPLVVVYNKIDTWKDSRWQDCSETLYVSAKTGEGLDALKQCIKKAVGYQPTEGLFSARRRHLDALNRAYEQLLNGKKQLMLHRAGELLAEDLRRAHDALCEITGEFSADDLLGAIFSSFCIGK